MKLIIVETPAQAKVLTGILGEVWRVEPCYGLVRGLPADALGIDIHADFQPTFVIARGKGALIRRLMKVIRASEAICAALPPGRTGEMMTWHLLSLLRDAKDKPVYRVSLPALTPAAIRAAFGSPRPLNPDWIDAELTHHIVDRLIEYGVNRATSTARDSQTSLSCDGLIALRLLSERDQAIAAFIPEAHWNVSAEFVVDGVPFQTQVFNSKGAPLTLRAADQVGQLQALLKAATFRVEQVIQDIQPSHAPDTLTADALIETAGDQLDLLPGRTLALADILYEAGWITYPLADAAALEPNVVEAAREYIRREYGSEYVPSEARERGGIQPTELNRVPENLPGHGAALYALIWRHCIAAQMSPALHRVAVVRLRAGSPSGNPYPIQLQVVGRMCLFEGGQRYIHHVFAENALPALTEGMTLQATHVQIVPLPPTPPVPYRPHTLVRSLSQIGMATSAAVQSVESLQAAGYAAAENGVLVLTTQGRDWMELLDAFGDLTSSEYRTQLSTDLERIAAGRLSRSDALREFWVRFGGMLRLPETESLSPTIGAHKPVLLRPAREV